MVFKYSFHKLYYVCIMNEDESHTCWRYSSPLPPHVRIDLATTWMLNALDAEGVDFARQPDPPGVTNPSVTASAPSSTKPSVSPGANFFNYFQSFSPNSGFSKVFLSTIALRWHPLFFYKYFIHSFFSWRSISSSYMYRSVLIFMVRTLRPESGCWKGVGRTLSPPHPET